MMVYLRKTAIYTAIFLCASAVISSACVAAVVEVTKATASSTYQPRVASHLIDYSATANGISPVNGFYLWSADSCWMSNGGSTDGSLWLAFELADAKDIRALNIWNMTMTGYLGRDVQRMDMYYLTDAEVNLLGMSFDSYFTGANRAKLENDFTSAGRITLGTMAVANNTTFGQVVDISADNAKWVVFTNLYAPGASGNYAGLGKVMFLDEKPEIGVAAKRAMAFSSYDNNPAGTGSRNVAQLNLGHGLYFYPQPDGSFLQNPDGTLKATNFFTNSDADYSLGTSWMSNLTAPANNWLAFELNEAMDLKGLDLWNYAHPGYDSRGVKDFEIYTLTPADVEALRGPEAPDFDVFNSIFTGSPAFSILDGKLNGYWEKQKWADTSGTTFTLQRADGSARLSEMEYLELMAPAEDVAWVIMKVLSTYGTDNYTGLGQVRFVGMEPYENGGGDGVPEPATWVLMAMGLAGLAFWRRRRG